MRVFANSDFWVFRRGMWNWRVGSVLKMNGNELMCSNWKQKEEWRRVKFGVYSLPFKVWLCFQVPS